MTALPSASLPLAVASSVSFVRGDEDESETVAVGAVFETDTAAVAGAPSVVPSFGVTVTDTVKGKPVTCAYPYLEATLNDLPSSSTTPQKYKETAPGVYDVGPIVFDKAGKWVARFHFFEDCSDEPEDSPHGHVAFYIQVP